MLASIISSKRRRSEMLAFSNDYYGFIFRATQSVELFCAYEKSVNTIFYDNNRRKACVKSVLHLALYIAVTKLHVKSGREIRPFF